MQESIQKLIFNPKDPNFILDPYPTYRFLRENDPIHYSPTGYWVITRYEDVCSALNDLRFRKSPAPFAPVNRRNRDRYLAADVASNIIAFLDPPDHMRPRRIIAASFQDYLKGKEPIISAVADGILSDLSGRNRIDFVRDFSIPFSIICMCKIMGFPENSLSRLEYWSDMFFYLFHAIPNMHVLNEVNLALAEFRETTAKIVRERKAQPRDDFISRLLEAKHRDYSLTEQQVIDNCMLIASDAIGNVHTGLTATLATLLRHDEQLHRMMEKPELIPAAVEECLRYESPAQYQGRIASEEIQIGGKTIKANSVVLFVLASANRDPAYVTDPDQFDIERDKPRHISFGLGTHRCVGSKLVSIEFETALKKIFDGSRMVKLANENLNWIARAGHRWPESLPLMID